MENDPITSPAEDAGKTVTADQNADNAAAGPAADEIDLPPLGLWEMFEPQAETADDATADDDAASGVLTRPRTSVWDLGRTRL